MPIYERPADGCWQGNIGAAVAYCVPNRRKRKRYCHRMAMSIALALKTRGGWGPDATLSRSDLVMQMKAAIHDWPAPEPVRQLAVERIMSAFDEADRTGDTRMILAVVRTAIMLDQANLGEKLGEREGHTRYDSELMQRPATWHGYATRTQKSALGTANLSFSSGIWHKSTLMVSGHWFTEFVGSYVSTIFLKIVSYVIWLVELA